MFSPTELMYLTKYLSKVCTITGTFVEAGCAYGATTVFLNKYMDDQGIDHPYYAIDTFSGFAQNDIDYEQTYRKKSTQVVDKLRSTFNDNKKEWFNKTLAMHDIHRVRSIQEDVSKFDFATLAPIAFCLLDVDLYLPIKTALPKIYEAMAPGGVLVVDDCWHVEEWDGAFQAYDEFILAHNLEHKIVGRKLGVIVKTP
jgi:SAM-dependent methyltransferase